MSTFQTSQEQFWAGKFGDEYTERNQGPHRIAGNIALFAKIFERTGPIRSLIEFGANRGLNLEAIRHLLPDAKLSAIEINDTAVDHLKRQNDWEVFHDSVLTFRSDRQWDFTLIKGVLIHIDPNSLKQVYANLYDRSSRYLCVVEYYNPTPVELEYRGHSGKLFKRDFAGEIMDLYHDLRLVDYGFVYRRDPKFPQDDVTWFLMEKGN